MGLDEFTENKIPCLKILIITHQLFNRTSQFTKKGLLHFYLTTSSIFIIWDYGYVRYPPAKDHQEHICSWKSWVYCLLQRQRHGYHGWLSNRVSEGLSVRLGLWLNDFGEGSRKEAGPYSGLGSVRKQG